jgi:N-methylhydantoinase B
VSPDPFTLEIVKGGLEAAGDEMFLTLQRTSKSPVVYEVLDYATGLTDERGQLVTQGNGVTGFIGALSFAVRSVLERFAAGGLEPGDVVILNDPFAGGGTHLSDVTLAQPIFHDGELVGFAANKAHWTEVGGKDPGSWTADATEVYQEGLQLPGVKVYEAGRPNQAVLELIEANVRTPDLTMGDLSAGVAALRVGERRVRELYRRYGAATVRAAIARLLDQGEERARRELARLPKGVFEAEDLMDADGLGHGPFPVRARVTITEDEFVCDFTGSAEQVAGPVNCGPTGLQSAVRTVWKGLIDPAIPANEGVFRPLRVVCPPGRVFTARRPAPTSAHWEPRLAAVDVVWRALAAAVPDRLPAGHFLSVCGTVVYGPRPDGSLWLLVEPQAGGWGAGRGKDGEHGLVCVGDGETYVIPVEVCESRYGLRVERFALDVVEGGAGEFRGGRGLVREYRVLSDWAGVTAIFGRHQRPPWGAAGGRPGSPNYVELARADGGVERVGRCARRRLRRGDVVRLVTGSGGGYGDPRRRPREKVLADLADEYVTRQEASEVYGCYVPCSSPSPLGKGEGGGA